VNDRPGTARGSGARHCGHGKPGRPVRLSTDAFATLTASLALIAGALAVLLVALRLAAPDRLAGLPPLGLAAATVVAAACMSGSLWYSEVADFIPCELCWYQRIAMYPLVAVLGIGALRRDPAATRPVATLLAGAGAIVSIWHLKEQWAPSGSSCSLLVPCSTKYVEKFGFVTIPSMALAGFLLILSLLWCAPLSPARR
jgi:disulfide bond formation protein DsbB